MQWGAVCDGSSVEDLAPLAEAIEVSQAELLATLPVQTTPADGTASSIAVA